MGNPLLWGNVPWSRQDMIDKLQEFSALYDQRPIANNEGGMKSPHMFIAWFALQALKPSAIVESGVWHGQGTWFFEQACPDAELYCIDINLSQIQYKSLRATYFDRDFASLDWSHLSGTNTVLFFDDHQNAYERTKTAHWFGFKHLLFEDNYPGKRGDCYSLKAVTMQAGFKPPSRPKPTTLKSRIKQLLVDRLVSSETRNSIAPNPVDAYYLRQNAETYYEFPPVFKTTHTRWGEEWRDDLIPTQDPLLVSVEYPYQQRFHDEATSYTWMGYVRLK